MSPTAAALSKAPGQTVLAFDFGERHIGVAVGDTETRLASPLGMFSATSGERRLAEIETLVREWRPERLLVGLPLAMDGTEHDMTRRARRFARQLAARFRLPVDFADERLSSAAAEEVLRETGRGGRKHKHAAHALAARIILQSYFDESP
ncbi:MAG: Holliday junction resolvase RuvX [Burkholderiales bacterium]